MRVAKCCGYPVLSKRSCPKVSAAIKLQLFYGNTRMARLKHCLERVKRLSD
jgi:hypothetical protein